jgi:hypothetical protein
MRRLSFGPGAAAHRLNAVDGFGPITNTRTLDDAISEVISRLSGVPATPRVNQLLEEARRYQLLMSTWEDERPEPEEQFEIVGHVMQLLGTAMLEVEGRPKPKERPGDDSPMIEIGDPLPPPHNAFEPRATDPLEDLLPRNEARVVAQPPRIVKPHLWRWRISPHHQGVRCRVVFESALDGLRHVMVRMDPGAELPAFQHGSSEVIQVLDGCVMLGEDEVPAGAFITREAGTMTAPLRSTGESTLLFIATDRELL